MEKNNISEALIDYPETSNCELSGLFEINEENAGDLSTLENIPVEEAPTFDEHDLQEYDAEKKQESAEELENKKKFIKSLAPRYKAEIVFANMQRQEGARPIVGHEKRIYLRKLEREAKKGRLDKYFL